jgi:hypothetical protein
MVSVQVLRPKDPQVFDKGLEAMAGLVAAIEQRSGQMTLIRLPRTGYLRQIDDEVYPRRDCLDPLASLPDLHTLDFDVPTLRGFDARMVRILTAPRVRPSPRPWWMPCARPVSDA